MAARLRLASSSSPPARVGPRPVVAGDWAGSRFAVLGDAHAAPAGQLDRLAWHATQTIGAQVSGPTPTGVIVPSQRVLTPFQRDLVYQRTPDVRAAIDAIVRRVATQDWDVVPMGDPSEDEYEEVLEECARIRDWLLLTPNEDGDTFQELVTAWITDLLKHDAGVLELVPLDSPDPDGRMLAELVAIRAADVHPRVTDKGRLVDYVQDPLLTGNLVPGIAPVQVTLPRERVLYLRLFPNTDGPEGMPLLESLVYETIAVLRASELVSSSVSLNEIPPGLLVLTGVANDAANRMRAEWESKPASEWKMRVFAAPTAGVMDARWVEFRKAPRELQLAELLAEIRRTIWRVFGVTRTVMGDTTDVNRATAQVQVDVSDSYLIGPILEIVQTKLNSRVIPLLTAERFRGRVQFEWMMQPDMSAAERLDMAKELTTLVGGQVLTPNEARDIKGYSPMEGGDELVARLPGGAIAPLAEAVNAGQEAAGTLAEDGVDAADGGDGEANDSNDAGSKGRRPPRAARGRSPRTGAEWAARHGVRRVRAMRRDKSEDMPSDWQPAGRFRGKRTFDLATLWDEVSGYARDAGAAWEQTRAAVVLAIASEYAAGQFDSARRLRAEQRISDELDGMVARWAVSVSPRYERVSLSARDRCDRWTGIAGTRDAAVARGRMYRDRAVAYLREPGGLVSDLQLRLLGLLHSVTDARDLPVLAGDHRASGLQPGAAAASVLQAAAQAFDALRSRIDNWSGRLVELASKSLSEELDASAAEGGGSGGGSGEMGVMAGEWWVEWVAVGDERMCSDCGRLGGQGFVPLRSLPTMPGGSTQCRARCRCVLVYWTEAEVRGGTADLLGGPNTGRVLSRPPLLAQRDGAPVAIMLPGDRPAVEPMDRAALRAALVAHYTGTPMGRGQIEALVDQWRAGFHRDLLEPPIGTSWALLPAQVNGAGLARLLGTAGTARATGIPAVGRASWRSAPPAARALAATDPERARSYTVSAATAAHLAAGGQVPEFDDARLRLFVDELSGTPDDDAYGAVLVVPVSRAEWCLDHRGIASEPDVGNATWRGELLAERISALQEILTARAQSPVALAYARRDAVVERPGALVEELDALLRSLGMPRI